MEKLYIGARIVSSEPINEWFKVRDERGNVPWSSKETFEQEHRELTTDEINLISFVSKKEKEG
jgi:hypothetical protein